MEERIRGNCHCQAVQFEIIPPTEFCSHCHCESCRRTHGAAFVTWTSVPNSQFKITKGKEHINCYESSPEIIWMNCSHCGSPLFQTTRYSPGRTYITVASVSDLLDRKPDSHVSYEERVDWMEICDTLPKYREKASEITGSSSKTD